MSTKPISEGSFIRGLIAQRKEAARIEDPAPRPRSDLAPLPPSRESEPKRPGSEADHAAIAAFAKKLEPWRARAFQRIVEQFYKGLARPQNHPREETATESVAAFRALIQETGPVDPLISVVSAAVRLFERGGSMAAAKRTVSELARALEARTGASTAVNVFPSLVEQAEKREPARTDARREEIRRKVSAFIVGTGPLFGFTQEIAAELFSALERALETNRELDAALEEAARLFREPFSRSHQDVLEQIAQRRVLAISVKSASRPFFDAFNRALKKTAEAHPAGPEDIDTEIHELRREAAAALGAVDVTGLEPNPWPALTALLERFGPTELGLDMLQWIRAVVPRATEPKIAESLVRAAEEAEPAKVARFMAETDVRFSHRGSDSWPDLPSEIAKIARLEPIAAMKTALALADALHAPNQHTARLVHAITRMAHARGKEDLFDHLYSRAERIGTFLAQLSHYQVGGEDPDAEREAIAVALAEESANTEELNNAHYTVGQMIQSIHGVLDRARIRDLVKAGLWRLADPDATHRHPAPYILGRILGAIGETPVKRQDADAQTDAARVALALTEAVANIDGNYQIPLERILEDVTRAFKRPQSLQHPSKSKKAQALRRAAKPSVPAHFTAYPEILAELSLTAFLHLSPDQLTWLIDRLQSERGRDSKRQIRDFIFACVSSGRSALLDTVIESEAKEHAHRRTIAYVARAYRENRLEEMVPWAKIVAGLRAGEDPIERLEQQQIADSLEALDFGAIPKNELSEAGLRAIAECGEAIHHLLDSFQAGQVADGIDLGRLRAPFLAALESVARGSWPDPKYENEAGKRQMAILTPEQQAIWREETVTNPATHDRAQASERRRAFALAKGLRRALLREARLSGIERPGWDLRSLEAVEALLGQKVKELRSVEKGSPEHRRISNEMRPLRDTIALLRLEQAIRTSGREPREALKRMRSALTDAIPALRRQGLSGAHQAALEIAETAERAAGSDRHGTYAVDEDGLAPLLLSTTGGCIHHGGVRRWALASLTCNANEKIIRVYEGSGFKYRAIMRFHRASMADYEGPVLWINLASQNGGGTEEHRQLLLRHALEKAKAMGVPIVSSQNNFAIPTRGMRAKIEQKPVHLEIDGGVTDALFSDYTFPSDVRAQRQNQPIWAVDRQLTVVTPG